MTDTVRIITNNVPRPLVDDYELTPREREEFDYINWDAIERGEDSATFMRYRGTLYDMGEFMTTRGMPEFSPLVAWDGYLSDSFFSGILVKYCRDDDDRVIVGLYLS